ncbi:MAG TPA: hypothetical protein DEO36_10025 [Flavobacteriaceae bacterium]|jgi:hypothetical protein|nr:hypothetical protein [Flavobacteriaceae bacterium]
MRNKIKMEKILLALTILATQLLNSQEINSRKGQFFASWGMNRSFYSTSDIHFNGNDFEFKLNNIKSDDRPYLDPEGLSPKYSNIKIGYFFNDNYNIVFGSDNLRYVLRNGQDVKIKGRIDADSYLYDGVKYNFDNVYNHEMIHLSKSFLQYEYNGLNYIFVGLNRFDNLNKFLHINTDKFEVNVEGGVDFGLVMPNTRITILGNESYENSSVAGFGLSANAGLNLTFFKYFFIKAALKYGYIDLKDIRISKVDASETVKQHFDFMEIPYSLGLRFQLFSPKKKLKNISKPDSNEEAISVKSSDTDKNIREVIVVNEDENSAVTKKCPGDKALAYKEKSNSATDIPTQKGYNWLSLYYTYKCKCDNGSIYPDDLVQIINNVVDSYLENTGGNYGKITKVSKCKPLTNN